MLFDILLLTLKTWKIFFMSVCLVIFTIDQLLSMIFKNSYYIFLLKGFTRTICSVYVCSMLVLLLRVQLNIVGAYIYKEKFSTKMNGMVSQFLSSVLLYHKLSFVDSVETLEKHNKYIVLQILKKTFLVGKLCSACWKCEWNVSILCIESYLFCADWLEYFLLKLVCLSMLLRNVCYARISLRFTRMLIYVYFTMSSVFSSHICT